MMENVKNTINYKTFFRKVKEDKNKWKQSLYSWVGIANTVITFPKWVYSFGTMSINIPAGFSTEINKIT